MALQDVVDPLNASAPEAVAAVCRLLAEQGGFRLSHRLGEPMVRIDTLVGPLLQDGASWLQASEALAHAHPSAGQTQYAHATVRRREGAVALEAMPPLLARSPLATLQAFGLAPAEALAPLRAALQRGRNVLCVGSYVCCWPLMAALVEDGLQPAALLASGTPSPRWLPLREAHEAGPWAIDRLATWGGVPRRQKQALSQCRSAVGHVDAVGLEQGLMRWEEGDKSGQPALSVLRTVHLLAVCEADEERRPKLVGVFELSMDEAGYRPRGVWTAADAPAPTAVAPLPGGEKAPWPGGSHLPPESDVSMATALARQRHLSTRAEPHRPRAPRVPPRTARGEAALAALQRPPPSASPPSTTERSPGWELEQDEEWAPGDQTAAALDPKQAAELEARYGLAPPPPPRPQAPAAPPPDALAFVPDFDATGPEAPAEKTRLSAPPAALGAEATQSDDSPERFEDKSAAPPPTPQKPTASESTPANAERVDETS